MNISYYLIEEMSGWRRLVMTSGDDSFCIIFSDDHFIMFDTFLSYGIGEETDNLSCLHYPSQEIKQILKQLLEDKNWRQLSILLMSIIKVKEKCEHKN